MRSLGKMEDRTNFRRLAIPSLLLRHFWVKGSQSQLDQRRDADPERLYPLQEKQSPEVIRFGKLDYIQSQWVDDISRPTGQNAGKETIRVAQAGAKLRDQIQVCVFGDFWGLNELQSPITLELQIFSWRAAIGGWASVYLWILW